MISRIQCFKKKTKFTDTDNKDTNQKLVTIKSYTKN